MYFLHIFLWMSFIIHALLQTDDLYIVVKSCWMDIGLVGDDYGCETSTFAEGAFFDGLQPSWKTYMSQIFTHYESVKAN